MLERLETRSLMSATVHFDGATGVVTVQGTDGDDSLDIRDNDKVSGALTGFITITDLTGAVVPWTRPIADVKQINVELGDGADGIDVDLTNLPSGPGNGAVVFTGAGKDEITIYNGGTLIFVDAGENADQISVNDEGSDFGTVAYGGSGEDFIQVIEGSNNALNPTVALGGNGVDELWGPTSAPYAGPDYASYVELHGGNGNDIFVSYNYETLVFGDKGRDTVTLYNGVKEEDVVVCVENILVGETEPAPV